MTLNNVGNNEYPAYPLSLINVGTYDMDATGTWLRNAFKIINDNFANVFSANGLTPQVINVDTKNSGQGDTMYAAFTKVNANFATLSALPAYSAIPFSVVNVGTQAYNGVIGLGDPGKLAMMKINVNFEYL